MTNRLRKSHCKSLQQIPTLEPEPALLLLPLQEKWSGGSYQQLPAEICHWGKAEDTELPPVFVPRGAVFQNQVNLRSIVVFFVGRASEFDALPIHFEPL